MLKWKINEDECCDLYIAQFNPGEQIFVRNIVCTQLDDVAHQVKATNRYNPRSGVWQFDKKAYVIVQDDGLGRWTHLRDAREFRENRIIFHNTVWPRLRRGLHAAGMEPIHVPGGEGVLYYEDEIAIGDHSLNGSKFFVIPRSEIGRYLALAPKKEYGE